MHVSHTLPVVVIWMHLRKVGEYARILLYPHDMYQHQLTLGMKNGCPLWYIEVKNLFCYLLLMYMIIVEIKSSL